MIWQLSTVFFAFAFFCSLWFLFRKNTTEQVEPTLHLPDSLISDEDPVGLIRQSLAQLREVEGILLAHYLCKPGCPWSNRDVFRDADPISASVQEDLRRLIQDLPDELSTKNLPELAAYENLKSLMAKRNLNTLLLMPMPTLNANCCWILVAVEAPSQHFPQILKVTARFLASDLALLAVQNRLNESLSFHEDVENRLMLEKNMGERTRNNLEVSLEQAQSRAVEAHRVKNEFLASVSHELRTPLNAIQGYTRIVLREENLSDRQRLSLDRVLASSKNLLRLINNILDYSRLEAGGIHLTLEQINVSQLGQDVLYQLESLAHEKSLEFHLDAEGEILTISDRARLERVLINLVGNAIKFTRQGSVRLKIVQKAGTLFIHVIDTGIGISDHDAPRIFERFEQGDHGRELSQTGTGLGLAISRRLVELLGGRIELVSIPGEGSTFTVRLPLFLDIMTAEQVLQVPEQDMQE